MPHPIWTRARRRALAITLAGALALAGGAVHAQDLDGPYPSPTITILSPTPDATLTTTATSIDLDGIAQDAGAITQVEWINDRGGWGIANGTASWRALGIPLQAGLNTLTVTARDATGQSASASILVTLTETDASSPAPAMASNPTPSSVASSLAIPVVSLSGTGVASAGPSAPAPRAVQSARTSAASQTVGGLVAAYAFEEGSGTTTADLSGNGNTGKLSPGVTWTTQGKFGKALEFHGAGFVTIDDAASLDLASGMTLEAWVFPTAAASGASTAVAKEGAGELVYALDARSATNRANLQVSLDAGPPSRREIHGPMIVPSHTWTHLAGSFDGATLRLYLNGTLAASQAVSGTLMTSARPLRIGGNALWGEYFRGLIDDVRVYNRALSQVEIRADMATPASTSAAAAAGQWAGPFAAPIVTIHGTLLRTGKVLVWDGLGGGGDVHLWDPATGAFTKVQNSQSNIFCSGHCALPDGRIVVAGGHIASHEGLADSNIFDPDTLSWTVAGSMSHGRWYPTVTTLPDGKLLVTAGENGGSGVNVETPEIYDPANNTWTPLADATADIPFYPHMFVLPDGRVLAASTTEGVIVSKVLDLANQTWTVVDPVAVDGGSAVMYRPGQIMKSGTHNDADLPTIPAAATTYVLDMNQASPAWQETASMTFPRAYHHLTILPDGNVLATGGGDTTDAVDLDGAIAPAELWSPDTQTWTTLAAMKTPRLYHNIALLLPDARVFVGGGGRFFGQPDPTDQLSYEVFSPPYLFRGPRPTITSAPATTGYGATMTVQSPAAASIASVVLVKPGSVTHSFNGEQRYVPLSFTAAGTTLSVQAPASANLAPPGTYMLFVVNADGVPSVARFVKVQ